MAVSPSRLEAPDLLEPGAAARRSAERAHLTGLETGTMWTFENPPLPYWDSTYGFRPSPEWLEHARLSAVRFGQICSASFVSPEGLVMTNHHCARDCAEAVSTEMEDRVERGFYAASRKEELLCPDLYLDQLVSIRDVTQRVRAAAPAGAADTVVAAAQDAARKTVERECERASGHTCQVVSLYHGGQFQLYEYRRYSPVKLVFIPELQAGFFGGDPDNFTFPRYALDVAFVRAYEADSVTAARTPHHFQWNPDGAEEGDLLFIVGNPGSTHRLATVSQLMYEQVYRHPFLVQLLEGQRDLLKAIAARSPRLERQVRDDLFGVENSLKAFTGELSGLRDTLLLGQKIRWENEFRSRIAADPELVREYGDTWNRIAEIQAEKRRLSPRLNVNDVDFQGAPYEQLAGTLVRYIREMAKPEASRSSDFKGDKLARTERLLRGATRADPEIGTRLLALRLQIADRWLDADDPFRLFAFQAGEGPEEAARRLVRSTRVGDASFRESLIRGGPEALAATQDPLVRLAVAMDDIHPELEGRWERLTASEGVQEERLARALFAAFGTDLPPDATFTLRISDGVIRRYPYNGTFAAPFTTFYGLYERALAFGNRMPWKLPSAFETHRGDLDLSTRFDFVSTNDITGGNSGSPMIDREGRIVGIAFDGNVEQLPNEFVFTTKSARTIGVDAAAITEALRHVYRAGELVSELLGERR
ncbi:MAG: S46 family peptidase [Gemmatimonadota bacterium]